MRRVFSFILVFVMLFAFAACGADKEQPTTPQTTAPTETAETIVLHEHDFISQVIAPTCTDDGYTVYSCSCDERYISDKVAATGHGFGQWVTTLAPTETATGTEERKCDVCSTTETRVLGVVIPDHVHSYTEEVVSAATCAREGQKRFTCTCGESYTESITKKPHSYTDTVQQPDCVNGGYTTHTCSVCQDSFVDSATSELGHDYGTNNRCTRCGASDPNQQTEPVIYTITVRTDREVLVPGVTVTLYVGDTAVGSGTTDSQGVAKITLASAVGSYNLVLADVPAVYEAKEIYTFSSKKVTINLKTVPVLDPNNHSLAMYKVGSTMANFVLTDTEGNIYDLSQLQQEKKLIILDFWYVACTWCRAEFPIFEEVLQEYGDDVVFLAVNPYDNIDRITEAREEDGVSFPMAQDNINLHKGFNISAYPTTVFINAAGKIVSIHSGTFADKDDFAREIESFLR